jgi:hypothetical protein
MLCAMPVTVRIDGLGELLHQQFSVVSRAQLRGLGMKDTAMQWRIRAGGPWQVLLPGVYLGVTGAPNLPQKDMAALLYGGPGSAVTGPAALMYHGLQGPGMLEMVDVLVPAGRQRLSTGFVRLHRRAGSGDARVQGTRGSGGRAGAPRPGARTRGPERGGQPSSRERAMSSTASRGATFSVRRSRQCMMACRRRRVASGADAEAT